jgi:uncharacterized protein
MSLLIDGYNLLNAAGILGRGRGPGSLERARQALLNTLVESIPADEVPRTTVVFDASESPWGVARQQKHQGITVMFASRDDDADTVIEELIEKDSAPKRLTVVSSDHRSSARRNAAVQPPSIATSGSPNSSATAPPDRLRPQPPTFRSPTGL